MENKQLAFHFAGEPVIEPERILISLKKEYYDSIRKGDKLYEFRRAFKRRATTAFIYLTSPDKTIPGYVEFGEPVIGTPEEISAIAEKQHTGKGISVLEYLEGARESFALPIRKLYEFMSPLSLDEVLAVDPDFVPPQLYIILNTRPKLYRLLKEQVFTKVIDHESENL